MHEAWPTMALVRDASPRGGGSRPDGRVLGRRKRRGQVRKDGAVTYTRLLDLGRNRALRWAPQQRSGRFLDQEQQEPLLRCLGNGGVLASVGAAPKPVVVIGVVVSTTS